MRLKAVLSMTYLWVQDHIMDFKFTEVQEEEKLDPKTYETVIEEYASVPGLRQNRKKMLRPEISNSTNNSFHMISPVH